MQDYGHKHRQQIIKASSNVIDPKVFEAKRQERARNRVARQAYEMTPWERLMRPVKWDYEINPEESA